MNKLQNKLKSVKKQDVKEFLIDNLVWLIGCFFYAIAINIFNVPNQIAQGGFSGLAIVVNYLTKLPVGAVNFALNIPLFVLSWFFVGKRFVFRSLWATAMLSVMIDVVALFSAPYVYTGDTLLAAVFGGACSGIGVALVLYRGATTGGTDVLGKLLRLWKPHISYGTVIMIADITIVLIAAIVFKSVESALYAAIVIFVSSKAIDFILYGFN
ncbi:MAG TPA: YitT family protein, partial [Ruminococcaceae bacterium]|nr:YitT family protein [Oscillospiraceae bacterium]